MDRLTDITALSILVAVGGPLRPRVAARLGPDHPEVGIILALGRRRDLSCPLLLRRPLAWWPRRLRRQVGRSLVALRRLGRQPAHAPPGPRPVALHPGELRAAQRLARAQHRGRTSRWACGSWSGRSPRSASLMPISLGGLAVREASLAALLAPFGVPLALGVADSLLWQTVSDRRRPDRRADLDPAPRPPARRARTRPACTAPSARRGDAWLSPPRSSSSAPARRGSARPISCGRRGRARVTVLEQNPVVGGNAGSFELDGLRLDYGSHRLHPACDPDILADIRALLGDDLLDRPRHGRISLRGKWIHFPLKPADLLLRSSTGGSRSAPCGDMAAKALGRRRPEGDTFASVLMANLGPTICEEFYFPYARKIWGREPEELSGIQARRRVSAGSFGKLMRKVASAAARAQAAGRGAVLLSPPRLRPDQRGLRRGRREARRGVPDGMAGHRAGAARPARAPWRVEAERPAESRTARGRLRLVHHPDHGAGPRDRPRGAGGGARPRPAPSTTGRCCWSTWSSTSQQFTEFDAHYFPGADIRITRLSEPKNYAARAEPAEPAPCSAPSCPAPRTIAVWGMSDAELGAAGGRRPGAGRDSAARARPSRCTPGACAQAYPIYLTGYEVPFGILDRWVETLPRLLSYGRQGLFAHDNTHHALFMAYARWTAWRTAGSTEERWAGTGRCSRRTWWRTDPDELLPANGGPVPALPHLLDGLRAPLRDRLRPRALPGRQHRGGPRLPAGPVLRPARRHLQEPAQRHSAGRPPRRQPRHLDGRRDPLLLSCPVVDGRGRELAAPARPRRHDTAVYHDDPRRRRVEFYQKIRQRGSTSASAWCGASRWSSAWRRSRAASVVAHVRPPGRGWASPPGRALGLSLLYAFGTPVFFRTAYLNQNLGLGLFSLFAFALLWNPGGRCRWRSAPASSWRACWGGLPSSATTAGADPVGLLGSMPGGRQADHPGPQAAGGTRSGTPPARSRAPAAVVVPVGQLRQPVPARRRHWMPPVEWVDVGYQGVGGFSSELLRHAAARPPVRPARSRRRSLLLAFVGARCSPGGGRASSPAGKSLVCLGARRCSSCSSARSSTPGCNGSPASATWPRSSRSCSWLRSRCSLRLPRARDLRHCPGSVTLSLVARHGPKPGHGLDNVEQAFLAGFQLPWLTVLGKPRPSTPPGSSESPSACPALVLAGVRSS